MAKTKIPAESQAAPAEESFPVRFEEIFGHGARIRLLRRSLAAGLLPQTLLLTGPPHVGKASVARAVSAALECDSPVEGSACGSCVPCRKCRRGLHPDVRLLTFELNEKGKLRGEIVVEQIRRDVTEPLALPPYEGRRLVFLVDPAEALNVNAQNALLKALEEAPPYAQFLLVASNASGLLPTVRSRCQEVALGPLPAAEMAAVMDRAGISREKRGAALAMAGGAPGRLLGGPADSLSALRPALCSLLAQGLELPAYPDLSPLVDKLAKEKPREVTGLCASLVRDALRVDLGQPPRFHADLTDVLRAAAKARGRDGLGRLAQRLAEAPEQLDRNVNFKLFLERLFLVP
jgi:DNA polymerase-3 subunit delta'